MPEAGLAERTPGRLRVDVRPRQAFTVAPVADVDVGGRAAGHLALVHRVAALVRMHVPAEDHVNPCLVEESLPVALGPSNGQF